MSIFKKSALLIKNSIRSKVYNLYITNYKTCFVDLKLFKQAHPLNQIIKKSSYKAVFTNSTPLILLIIIISQDI